MAVILTIENLSEVNRYLKQASRACRQATYSSTGGTDADTSIVAFRSAISGAASTKAAAKALIDAVNIHVL